jgi:hypothetical protein
MADNVQILDSSQTGVTIRTEDIGGIQHNVVILSDSAGTLIDPTTQVAHDAADGTTNPTKIGAKAIAGQSSITPVAAADRTNLYAGLDGVMLVRPHCGLEDIVSGTAAITDGSSTSVIAAVDASTRVYVTSVVISNSSSTAAEVTIRDGAAGTVKLTLPVPASKSGVIFNPPVPLPFTANTAICADPDATLSTINVTIIGFKSKV